MKDLITYVLIFGLLCYVVFDFSRPEPKNYDAELIKMEILGNDIKRIQNKLKTVNYEIDRIKTEMVAKDSVIDNADGEQLDSLFTNFFARTANGLH